MGDYPDLWNNGVWGLLFLVGAAIAPRFTLIFFASIDWNIWFFLAVFFVPELTLISLLVFFPYAY